MYKILLQVKEREREIHLTGIRFMCSVCDTIIKSHFLYGCNDVVIISLFSKVSKIRFCPEEKKGIRGS